MRALISGQAGVAVIIEGQSSVSVDVEHHERIPRSQDDWPHLLAEADDLYEIEAVSDEQVIAELDLAWRKDRSLHLVLMLLDRKVDRHVRCQSADYLEQFVADDRVSLHVLNRLHVACLPGMADVDEAIKIATKSSCGKVVAVLEQTSEAQDPITRCRQAWDLLPPDLFGSSGAKESFGFKAVERGLFTALSSPKEGDPARHEWADPEVIRNWKREIKSLESSFRSRQNVPARPNADALSGKTTINTRGIFSRHMIAVAAGFIVMALVVATILFLLRPVAALDSIQLGTSEPGVQVVQASFKGFQQQLYGSTLIPYPLRSQSKKEAEHFFASGDVYAHSGRLRDAARAYRESNSSFGTFAARLNEAVALFNSSELTEAEGALKSLLPEAGHLKDELWGAAVLSNLGQVYRTQGRFDEADNAFSAALKIDRQSRYKAGEAANLNNLALVLLYRGKAVKALESYQAALAVSEEAGVGSSAADSKVNIGLILSVFGRSSEAEQYLKSAAKYYETRGSPLEQAYYFFTYGQYMSQFVVSAGFYGKSAPRELDQALSSYQRALELYTSASNKRGQALALMAVGQKLRVKGQLDKALASYRRALMESDAIGDLPGQATARREIGTWYYAVKRYDEALDYFREALNLARQIGAIGEQCITLESLSTMMAVSGHPDEALKYINDAVELASKEGDAFSQAVAYDNLGFLLYKVFNQRSQAVANLEHAYDLYSKVNSPMGRQTKELINAINAEGTRP